MCNPTIPIPLLEIVMHPIVDVFVSPGDFRFAMIHTVQAKPIDVIHSSQSSRGNQLFMVLVTKSDASFAGGLVFEACKPANNILDGNLGREVFKAANIDSSKGVNVVELGGFPASTRRFVVEKIDRSI